MNVEEGETEDFTTICVCVFFPEDMSSFGHIPAS